MLPNTRDSIKDSMSEAKSDIQPVKSPYQEVVGQINNNPKDPSVWGRVTALVLADQESTSDDFYAPIPGREMIETAKRLRDAPTLVDKYKILVQRSSNGVLWYDMVLGRANDIAMSSAGDAMGTYETSDPYGEKVIKRRTWKRGLDIGTGTGNSLTEMQKHARKSVGIDSLDFLIRTAGGKGELKGAALVVGDALHLPFADESFDLVVTNGVTHYIPKHLLPNFITEVSRVLEPGGSYFESFLLIGEGNVLPKVEEHIPTTPKGLLALLMDRQVTDIEEEPGPSALTILKNGFKRQGLQLGIHEQSDKGVFVLEFRKAFSRYFEAIRHHYLGSSVLHRAPDAGSAQDGVLAILFGDTIIDQLRSGASINDAIIRSVHGVPKGQLIQLLDELSKLAERPEIISAASQDKYIQVFVSPLHVLLYHFDKVWTETDSWNKARVEAAIKKNLSNIGRKINPSGYYGG